MAEHTTGHIIGNVLREFSGGLQQGFNFGAIFEQNKIRREKLQRLKMSDQAVQVDKEIEFVNQKLTPGSKTWNEYFDFLITQYKDFEPKLRAVRDASKTELVEMKRIQDSLYALGVSRVLVNETLAVKGRPGL